MDYDYIYAKKIDETSLMTDEERIKIGGQAILKNWEKWEAEEGVYEKPHPLHGIQLLLDSGARHLTILKKEIGIVERILTRAQALLDERIKD